MCYAGVTTAQLRWFVFFTTELTHTVLDGNTSAHSTVMLPANIQVRWPLSCFRCWCSWKEKFRIQHMFFFLFD